MLESWNNKCKQVSRIYSNPDKSVDFCGIDYLFKTIYMGTGTLKNYWKTYLEWYGYTCTDTMLSTDLLRLCGANNHNYSLKKSAKPLSKYYFPQLYSNKNPAVFSNYFCRCKCFSSTLKNRTSNFLYVRYAISWTAGVIITFFSS